MKLFVRKGYQAANLPVPAKLVYTLFLVFIAVGVWSSWVIYADRIGPELSGPAGEPSVEERYVNRPVGGQAGPSVGAEPEGGQGDPALDLEPEPTEAAPAPPEDLKRPWVLDVFHQHLFSVSVVFLILAHLFMLCGLHAAVAGSVIVVAGLSSLLHVLAPVIIWKTGGWLWLMPVTGAAMGLSWSAMILWTLGALWLVRRAP